MKKIIRRQYRASVKPEINEIAFLQAANQSKQDACVANKNDKVLTCGLFRYKRMVFLYMEFIIDDKYLVIDDKYPVIEDPHSVIDDKYPMIVDPSIWFPKLTEFLCKWPQMDKEKEWVEMFPVFWFDSPVSIEQWKRKQNPEKRCGRIAVLYPDKLLSYICHHQAIVQEGLLKGDRYQSIAVHENILFSYFETPRDREVVNIKRVDEKSSEIDKWKNVDPVSHFHHFPEANGDDFLVISTIFDIG